MTRIYEAVTYASRRADSALSNARDMFKNGRSKIDRYGWRDSPVDGPGEFQMLDKNIIKIDHDHYQRDPKKADQITKMAAEWSWVACGAISVAIREDGEYWAMDGQHRLLAARKRADITHMPCMLFLVSDIKSEAAGFIRLNTLRRPLSGVETFRALVTAEDPHAVEVDHLLRLYGYRVSSSNGAQTVKCVKALQKISAENPGTVSQILSIYRDCFDGHPIKVRVALGLAEIARRQAADLSSKRFRDRCASVRHAEVERAIGAAAAYYAHGGPRVFAEGIANALNKGLRHDVVDTSMLISSAPK